MDFTTTSAAYKKLAADGSRLCAASHSVHTRWPPDQIKCSARFYISCKKLINPTIKVSYNVLQYLQSLAYYYTNTAQL